MRIFITLSLLIFTIYPASAATCPVGQYYDAAAGKCASCPADHYCPGNDDNPKCPTSHPNSAANATKQADCFKECKPETIDNGRRVPTSNYAYFNTNCSWTTECDNTTDTCNGYHAEGSKCVANKRVCPSKPSNASEYFQVYSNGAWSSCYIVSCKEHYEILKQNESDPNTMCGKNVGTKCTKADCIDILKNCPGNNIQGEWKWSWWPFTKNYANCKCYKDVEDKENHGTFNQVCDHASGEGTDTKWTNCKNNSVSSCDEKYCEIQDLTGLSNVLNKCSPVPAGYYSGANTKTCSPCPIGSTSAGFAESIDKCYITSATKFVDGRGEITLPISGNLYYKK